jgi:dihydrofolate reductase
MRKLVAGFAASLDGYIEGPNKEYDWILIDKEIDFAEISKRFDTYLFGRSTYEMVSPMGGKPNPGIKNYVYSKTLTTVTKNYELITSDLKQHVQQLKQQDGKDIAIFGGASLLSSLLDLRLVDEISISYIPVLLGQGKPMVDVLNKKVWLKYKSSKNYSNGTLLATYEVK